MNEVKESTMIMNEVKASTSIKNDKGINNNHNDHE